MSTKLAICIVYMNLPCLVKSSNVTVKKWACNFCCSFSYNGRISFAMGHRSLTAS